MATRFTLADDAAAKMRALPFDNEGDAMRLDETSTATFASAAAAPKTVSPAAKRTQIKPSSPA